MLGTNAGLIFFAHNLLRHELSNRLGWDCVALGPIRGLGFGAGFVVTVLFYKEFAKIRGTFLGVPTIRIIVFWGFYWGPLI